MKKLISLFTVMLFLCMGINSIAQVAPYTFTQSLGTYTEIIGDTTVAFATTTTTSGPLSMDDSIYANNSLPFTFTYNGVGYNNVVISSNGFVTFGALLPGITNYTPISSVGLAYNVSTGYANDLIGTRGFTGTRASGNNVVTAVAAAQFVGLEVGRVITGTGIPAGTTIAALNSGAGTVTLSANATASGTSTLLVASGSIVRGTTGVAGSRIHTIQFRNTRNFSTGANANCINFQIKLYETSNKIEVVYGTNSNSAAVTGQVGLRGTVNTDFNNRNTATAGWATTIAGVANTAALAMSSTITPSSGRTFTWTPPVPPVNNDMGVSAIANSLNPVALFAAGTTVSIISTAKNYGLTTQNSVPVYYNVNGGSAVGPVNTVGPIASNATENVTFSGANAFTPATPGTYTVKSWTVLAGDENPSNDTATIVYTVLGSASVPYVENWSTLSAGWTVVTENVVGTTAIWALGIGTSPLGVSDTMVTGNFFNASAGRREMLRSPLLNLTGTTNPVLNFYIAYKTFTGGEQDTVEVLVSTDNGVSFFPASTVYNKNWNQTPSLATRPPSSSSFFPDSSSQWRHESISLANVAGLNNVVIGFRGKSAFGNRAWLDDIIVSNVNSLCTDVVTATGSYNCNALVTATFVTVGRPAPFTNIYDKNVAKQISNDKENLIGSIESINSSDIKIISNNQSDNPGGGTLFVSQYTSLDPGQTISPNVGFTNATPPVGPAYDPSFVYHDYWFTVTYTGNDYLGYATYDLKIDLDGLVFTDPSTLYIVKRDDRTGSWICQNTTMSGNTLIVSGLTDFCDFAIAGAEALPVELASFVSTINGRNVELNWATSSENNNSGFDIERSTVNGSWTKVGNVAGNGTTSTGHSYSFTDRNLASGNYSYRLKQIDFNGNFEYFNLNNEVNVGIPTKFDLSQNYPNPFNPSTKISFDLPVDGKVSLKIFDMSGKELMTLVNEVKTAGYYSVSFNASSLSSGVYFYSLSADNFTATKKMMLIK
ncbi:MAG TPA: T9SS type A sorting domain-containing protein [Ignavibacteria bacterium]|nr:T9SS type A sorting domain-containing protein [Ignavibacteria bacterium]